MGGFAWVTLATNDSYSLGALVLAHSLRRVGTLHDLAVLITPGVSPSMREKLSAVFTLVREVNVLDSKDEANLEVLQRPELGITFTKLHCWRLTQYEKCVFIDADALVVRNCDELFEREELSAAPDVGWPDCFNSGVFVFIPSQQTFSSITKFAASQGSFDGADQGLLNMYFSDWAHKDISKHLPFIYNMCSAATYSYAPAFKQYGENVRIIHFIGNTKPWLQYFDTLTGIVQPPPGCDHLQPLLQMWWNIFCDQVHPQLTNVMASHQDNFSHENEINQEMMDSHLAAQRLAEQESSIDDEQAESKSLIQNITEISAFCDFLEDITRDSEDHNHRTDHEKHSDNHHINHHIQSKQLDHKTLECSPSSSASTSHDCRQNSNSDSDQRQTDLYFPNSSHIQTPCTDPNNVVTQSALSASPCIENANGGIAGALSQMTLGENRTDEQRAIEEHMRKQQWEQGTVDFMGRDSFDNILKKIEQTLSSAPAKQPAPPKETRQPKTSSSKSSEMEAAVEESEVALPVLATDAQAESGLPHDLPSDTCQIITSSEVTPTPIFSSVAVVSESDSTICEKSSTLIQDIVASTDNLVPIVQPSDVAEVPVQQKKTADLSETLVQMSLDDKQTEILTSEFVKETQVPVESKQIVEIETVQQQVTDSVAEVLLGTAVEPPVLPESHTVAASTTIQQPPEQIASEATTECPVPIQVAESVLQTEPKESVSEDPKPVGESVLSSITPIVQESVAAVSETPVEPDQTESTENKIPCQHMNGDDQSLQLESESIPVQSSTALISRSANTVSIVHEFPPRAEEQLQQASETFSSTSTENVIKLEEAMSNIQREKSISDERGLTGVLPQTENVEKVVNETQGSTISLEQATSATESSKEFTLETSLEEESPLRPTRSKDLKIPATPIVIGPTPPTSPPLNIDTIQSDQQEVQKQIEKKPQQIEPISLVEAVSEPVPSAACDTPVETISKENLCKDDAPKQPESPQKEKKMKKMVKKSSAESDTTSSPESEGSSKKVVKKVVKKVAKKPKEGGETDSSNVDKPKKTVKTVKKAGKTSSSTSLDADKEVPETPPLSAGSEPPVPPKRKSKSSSTTKVTEKKLDES